MSPCEIFPSQANLGDFGQLCIVTLKFVLSITLLRLISNWFCEPS